MTKQHLQQRFAHDRMAEMGKICPPDAECPLCPTPPGVEEESPARSEEPKLNFLVQAEAAERSDLILKEAGSTFFSDDMLRSMEDLLENVPTPYVLGDDELRDHVRPMGAEITDTQRLDFCLEHDVFPMQFGGWYMMHRGRHEQVGGDDHETARDAIDNLILNGRS